MSCPYWEVKVMGVDESSIFLGGEMSCPYWEVKVIVRVPFGVFC